MSARTKLSVASRPFVFVNMAMTADGKIASANRAVSSFGSERDLVHLYELRATADAVMCGARTVEVEGTTLGPGGKKFQAMRRRNGRAEFNLRIIVSGNGSLNPAAGVFRARFSPIILLTTERISPRRLKQLRAVADEVKICGRNEVDFSEALHWLRRKWGVKRLLCEGGGTVNGALFRAGLVDQIHLTICPGIFGGSSAPSIADGPGFDALAKVEQFRLDKATRVKAELFTVFSKR